MLKKFAMFNVQIYFNIVVWKHVMLVNSISNNTCLLSLSVNIVGMGILCFSLPDIKAAWTLC